MAHVIFTCFLFYYLICLNGVQGSSSFLQKRVTGTLTTLEEYPGAESLLECLAYCQPQESCTLATFDKTSATCRSIGGNLTESNGPGAQTVFLEKCENPEIQGLMSFVTVFLLPCKCQNWYRFRWVRIWNDWMGQNKKKIRWVGITRDWKVSEVG